MDVRSVSLNPMSKPEDNTIMWQVAGGVLVAFAVMGIVRSCQQRAAVQQFNDQMQTMTAEMAESARRSREDARKRAAVSAAATERQRAVVEASRALPPGHRCIGKDLFRRVENGWVEVTDGSAKLICGS